MSDRDDHTHWDRLRPLLEEALELDAPARRRLLERVGREQPELLEPLERLIEADGGGDERLDRLALKPRSADPLGLCGRRVAGFELLEPIGSGGMGTVYSARQLEPARRVAIKVGRADVLGATALARLTHEAQILAGLSHPALAQIYASGTLEAGGRELPWFAMEHVENARPILDFAAVRGSSARERLLLVLQAAAAIEAAHRRGVVHRDLKSSNVLVDPQGHVKVIDFGIARETAAEPSGEQSDVTRTGDLLGTLATMAPEQALGQRDRTAEPTDVYALGGLLYELLCGVPPIELRGASVLEAARRLSEQPIRRPIEAELDLGPDARWVLERALAKEPSERYPSAAEFAQDLERLIDGRPVTAGPPTATYRVRSFVRRHRGLVWATAAVVAALSIGIVGTSLGLRRARANAARAEAAQEDVFRLVSRATLNELRAELEQLWPPVPEVLPRLEAWLARARSLEAARPALAAALARVPDGAPHAPGSDPLGEAERANWLQAELSHLIADLDAFFDPQLGPVHEATDAEFGWGVERRLAHARQLTPDGPLRPALERNWAAAAARLAADPRTTEVNLPLMIDLVPLGPDPRSGLEEFALLASGRAPARDAAGRLELAHDTALVLVLIPPGRSLVGSQNVDPNAAAHIPGETPGSLPVKELDYPAFLISKYELSRGAWTRMAGDRDLDPQRDAGYGPTVLFQEAVRVFKHFDLQIPTQRAWEIAARAGTATRWYFDVPAAEVGRFANLRDASYDRAKAHFQVVDRIADYDDGYPVYAPLDALEPNGFGLHHVIGNSREWVLLGRRFALRRGEDETEIEDHWSAAHVGGSLGTRLEETASAWYQPVQSTGFAETEGLRPVRMLAGVVSGPTGD